MRTDQTGPRNIDEYIAGFPPDVQELLEKVRLTIRTAAPDAEEKISYQIPTFTLKGNMVHFAAYKNHIGFYPASSGIQAFKQELSIYEGSKGTVCGGPKKLDKKRGLLRGYLPPGLKSARRPRTPPGSGIPTMNGCACDYTHPR